MNFDFSPEQKMFRDQVRRALEDSCPLQEVRRVLEHEAPRSDAAWRTLVELGATAAAIPEAYGGLGLGYEELCVAAEEVGRALAPTPISSSIYLAAEAILLAGTEAQKATWLPQLASGEISGCFAATGEGAKPVTFREGRLSGRVSPVADGQQAGLAVVLAEEAPDVWSLVLAAIPQEGVACRSLRSVDPSREVTELTFDGAAGERLGPRGGGADLAQRISSRASILVAFEQIGGAERALYMARDYALQRKAFGRQIGSFQAIKHKLANVYIKLELARAHAYYGAWALATDAADLPLAAASARITATEAFNFAAQENIQTHGGIGFTWESDCQLFYRRARLLALQLGSSLRWKERAAGELERANHA